MTEEKQTKAMSNHILVCFKGLFCLWLTAHAPQQRLMRQLLPPPAVTSHRSMLPKYPAAHILTHDCISVELVQTRATVLTSD